MGLFYLLSGYFSTGSYTRKGLRRYIQDRAIRLLIPIAFFDLLLGPIIFMIAKAGGVVPEMWVDWGG
jgi:fucose 4-O-acetylase-like acetyltransferase